MLTPQNQSVISKAEKILADFKPVTYDVNAQTKALDSFEATAVRDQSIVRILLTLRSDSGTAFVGRSALAPPRCYSYAAAFDYLRRQQVEQAQASATKIDAELKDLKATLHNIQEARPFDQLTASDVIAARPEIAKTVEAMVKKGKWILPGYEEKFGSTYTAPRDSVADTCRPRCRVTHAMIDHNAIATTLELLATASTPWMPATCAGMP